MRCAPNRLLGQSRPTQANRVWVSDITYLPLASGAWAYLCAFQDACSKHVVGWHVITIHAQLVTTALRRAFWAQPPAPWTWSVIPTAAASTAPTPTASCSTRTSRPLAEPPRRMLRQRPGRKPAPGFGRLWSGLKTEVLELREWPVFADLADAQASVADYFD
ncbi:DDE-type integrase/transposase/recombinase [Hymenobacter sp. B81]|uniref:DDE-type integrase/transposase/recombinase n=1 Tax=Hymenobacter sp. B81 TaxID=3344878 RepID=UPI0037DC51EE